MSSLPSVSEICIDTYLSETKLRLDMGYIVLIVYRSSQPCLEDLKAESEKKKWRNMNPRERMRIKKQIKSDDEAMRLQYVMYIRIFLN